MKVICLQDAAFYSLIDNVTDHIREKYSVKEDKWISDEDTMHKLRITSRTTLQKFRDQGKIRYTQPEKKLILYDTDSIQEYLEKHPKDTF